MPYVRGYVRRGPRRGLLREPRLVRVRGYHRSRPHSSLVVVVVAVVALLLLIAFLSGRL
jgi:hypothetical protein